MRPSSKDGDEPDLVLGVDILEHPVPVVHQERHILESAVVKDCRAPPRACPAAEDAARQNDPSLPVLP